MTLRNGFFLAHDATPGIPVSASGGIFMRSFKTGKGTELPLLDLRGKPYLQVAHRLVWFREDHPDWGIETSIIEMTEEHSVAKAVIRDQAGKVMSTAHKQENKRGFADHMEKAETGAVGRALAMCGYGTQFAPELEEGERLADAPVESPRPAPKVSSFSNEPVDFRRQAAQRKASPAQINMLKAKSRAMKLSEDDLISIVRENCDGVTDLREIPFEAVNVVVHALDNRI
jgi:hypothetical protein